MKEGMEYRRTVVLPRGLNGNRIPRSLLNEVADADLVVTHDGSKVVKDRYGKEGGRASAELMRIARAGRGVLA